MPRLFTNAELNKYLEEVGSLVPDKKACSVVVIGGAVSVLLLKSRNSTEDVDVFTSHLSKKQRNALSTACKTVAEQHGLPETWMNATVQCFYDNLNPIVRDSMKDDNLIAKFGNLKIYAADFEASVLAKLKRFRLHDKDDIVALIRWEQAKRPRSFEVWSEALSLKANEDLYEKFSECWGELQSDGKHTKSIEDI
ncbi:hypothetical protein HDU86_006292 [Geranomyces michiganensis]|nr:hypothetical protein HDU86_006292 [Geranomyces michiganensis]